MPRNRLRISLVIPVYNEESYLAGCLRSALSQRLPFHEIIVVDNNSTDTTRLIVESFHRVKVLHEPRQGVVHARNRGFSAATGNIIARIDADTRLPEDWTTHIAGAFSDSNMAAITGNVTYYETSLAKSLSLADNLMRRTVSRILGRHMALQGANMAIRRSVWQRVQAEVCCKAGVHEDFDLAIHAAQQGYMVRHTPNLQAEVAFRQAAGPWRQFASYYWHCPKTYLKHGVRRGYWLVSVAIGMIMAYPILHLLSKRYTLKSLQLPAQPRVNPATFVD